MSRRFPQPLTHLIHENLSVLVTFAFSRIALESLRENKFEGSWKYLDRALFTVSEQRAEKACLELAMFLRLLDDEENIATYLRQTSDNCFGHVTKSDQPDEPLYFRDLTNKIIHAHHLEWDFKAADDPKVICISRQPDRWLKAEVGIVPLAALCGELIA